MSATLLGALTALPLCVPAQAGQWQIRYRLDGEQCVGDPDSYPDVETQSVQRTEIAPYWLSGFTSVVTSLYTITPNTKKASAKGKIEVVFKWLPEDSLADDPPPARVSARVRSIAGSGVYLFSANATPEFSVDNGLGIGPIQSEFPDIENKGMSQTGTRLYTVDNSSRKDEVVVATLSGSATSQCSISPGVYGFVSASWRLTAQEDDRSVTLSRAGATGERTTYEGGVPVTHGDTIYTYYNEKMFLPLDQRIRNVPNDLSFSGACSGNWSLNGTTNWVVSDAGAFLSPGTNDFEGTYDLRRTAVLGSQGLTQESSIKAGHWVGDTEPRTVTIKYFARDNSDGAEGEARYVLTMHDPIEKDHERTESLWVYTPVWGSHVHGGDPNGVQKEYGPLAADGQNNPSVDIGRGTSRGSAQTLSGELGFEEVGAAFGYSYEWSEETSNEIGRSVPVNIDVPADYFTYPQFEDEYLRHNVFFRHFTAAGEHKLADVEFPPGSGYYDPQFHECEFDEPKGGRVMWAPPQPDRTGHIPNYGDHIEPTPNRSGGSS